MVPHIEAGALVRGQIRRALLSNDIKFVEDKGFLDSIFYLKDTPERNQAVLRALDRLNKQLGS